jgi:hypothetical protein
MLLLHRPLESSDLLLVLCSAYLLRLTNLLLINFTRVAISEYVEFIVGLSSKRAEVIFKQ